MDYTYTSHKLDLGAETPSQTLPRENVFYAQEWNVLPRVVPRKGSAGYQDIYTMRNW